tara:strand:+ start:3894 stop:13397 length:9504 start_codon:yes stop_codon:yes gene_type:complete
MEDNNIIQANPDALKDAFDLFTKTGYTGNIDEFTSLLSTNPEALTDAHGLFTDTGYTGSLEDFGGLLGVKKKGDTVTESPGPIEETDTSLDTTVQETDDQAQSDSLDTQSEESVEPTEEEAEKSQLQNKWENTVRKLQHGFLENKWVGGLFGADPSQEWEELQGAGGDIDMTDLDKQKEYYQQKETEETLDAYHKRQKDQLKFKGDEIKDVNQIPVQGIVGAYLIGKEEEEVVPILQDMYGAWGFTFEQSGVGDNVTITSNVEGVEPLEISLDNAFTSSDKAQALKLAEYLTKNATKKDKVNAQRLYDEAKKGSKDFKRLYDTEIVQQEMKDITTELQNIASEYKDFGKKDKQMAAEIADFELRWTKAQQEGNISPELKQEYLDVMKKSKAMGTEARTLQYSKQENSRRTERLKTVMAQKVELLAQQGDFFGRTWNSFLNGVGALTAGAADVSIDAGVTGYYDLRKFLQIPSDTYEGEGYVDQVKKDLKKDIIPALRGGYRDILGDTDTTDENLNKAMETFFGGAWYGLVQSMPAMVGASAVTALSGGGGATAGASMLARAWSGLAANAPGAAVFGLQSIDFVNQEMENNPEFANISENEKWLVKGPTAIAVGLLENFGFRNVLKGKAGPISKYIGNVTQRMLKKAPKGATYEALERIGSQMIKRDIKRGLIKRSVKGTLAAGLSEAETGGSQHLAEVGIKDIYNTAKEKELFHDADFFTMKTVMGTIRSAGQEMIGGHIMHAPIAIAQGLSDYSLGSQATDMQFNLTEAMVKDADMRTLMMMGLKDKIINGELTYEEAQNLQQDVFKAAATFNQLPDGLSITNKKKAFDLLTERQKLEKEVKGKDKSLVKDDLERIGAINQELEGIKPDAEGIDLQISQLQEQREKLMQEGLDEIEESPIKEPKELTDEAQITMPKEPEYRLNPQYAQKIAKIDDQISSLNSQKDAISKQETGGVATNQQAGDLQTVETPVREGQGQQATEGQAKQPEAGVLSDKSDATINKMENTEELSDQEIFDAQDELVNQLDLIDNDTTLSPKQKESMKGILNDIYNKLDSYETKKPTVSGKPAKRKTTRVVEPGERTPSEKTTGKTPSQQVLGQELTTDGGTGKITEKDGKVILEETKDGETTTTELDVKDINELELVSTTKDENGNVTGATFKMPDKVNKFGVTEFKGQEFTINNPEIALDLAIEKTRAEVGGLKEVDEVLEDHRSGAQKTLDELMEGQDEGTRKQVKKIREEIDAEIKKKAAEEQMWLKAEAEADFKAAKKKKKKERGPTEQSKLKKAIAVAKRALKKISKTADIFEANSKAEMIEAYEIQTGVKITPEERKMAMQGNAMVSFDDNGKIEFIYVTKDATAQDVAHEMWHIILTDVFGNDPKRYKKFQNSIDNILKQNGFKDISNRLNDFIANYEGDMKAEEYLAELGSIIVEEGLNIEEGNGKSLMAKLRELINKFSNNLVGQKVFDDNATGMEVLSFMTDVSNAYAAGQDIAPKVEKQRAKTREEEKAKKKEKEEREKEREKYKSVAETMIEKASTMTKAYVKLRDRAKKSEKSKAFGDIKSLLGKYRATLQGITAISRVLPTLLNNQDKGPHSNILETRIKEIESKWDAAISKLEALDTQLDQALTIAEQYKSPTGSPSWVSAHPISGEPGITSEEIKKRFPELYTLVGKWGNRTWTYDALTGMVYEATRKVYKTPARAKLQVEQNAQAQKIMGELAKLPGTRKKATSTKAEAIKKISDAKHLPPKVKTLLIDMVNKIKGDQIFNFIIADPKKRAPKDEFIPGGAKSKGGNWFRPISNTLQITDPGSFIHEIGHWAYEAILTHEDRAKYMAYVNKRFAKDKTFTQRASELMFGKPIPMKIDGVRFGQISTNAMDNFDEYFAEQFRQWYFNDILVDDEVKSLMQHVKEILDDLIKHMREVGYNKEMISTFDKIMDTKKQMATQPKQKGRKEYTPVERKKWRKDKGKEMAETKKKFANSNLGKQIQGFVNKLATDPTYTVQDYLSDLRKVDRRKPKTQDQVPKVSSFEDVELAITENLSKGRIVGLDVIIPDGTPVQTRVDINSLNNYGVPVVPVKPQGKDVKITDSENAGYGPGAVLTDAFWELSKGEKKKAFQIAKGDINKTPMGWMQGNWVNKSPSELRAYAQSKIGKPGWTQVSMNPKRHSYPFMVNEDGVETPVKSAKEIIQIGTFMIARDAVPGDPMDDAYKVPDQSKRKLRFRVTPGTNERASILQQIMDVVNDPNVFKDDSLVPRSKINKEARENLRKIKDKIIDDFAFWGNEMPINELEDMLLDAEMITETGKAVMKQANEVRAGENRILSAEATKRISESGSTAINKTVSLNDDIATLEFFEDVREMNSGTVFEVNGQFLLKTDFLNTFNENSGLTEVNVMQEIDPNKAGTLGARTKINLFLGPSVMNFKTLLYSLYGKGKDGKAWFEKTLLRPLEEAYFGWGTDKARFAKTWVALKKKHKISKVLGKMSGIKSTGDIELTNDQIVYVYNAMKQPSVWTKLKNGGINTRVMNTIADYMVQNPQIKDYADELPGVFSQFRHKVETSLDSVGLATFGKPVYRRNLEDNVTFYMSKEGGNMSEADARAKAQQTLALLEKIYDGEIPRDIPYYPIRVQGEEDGNLSLQQLMDKSDPQNAITVITGNLIQRQPGGALKWYDTNSDTMANQYMEGVLRGINFLQWFKRSNAIFNSKNMERIKTVQGSNYTIELQRSIARIITNKRMPMGNGKGIWTAVNNWVNSSQALIMFFNIKSAILQNLSSVNFMIKNPMAYMEAMKSPWEMVNTMNEIWNSDYLVNRRGSGAGDMLMEDMIKLKNAQKGFLGNWGATFFEMMFKVGYTPTRTMDSWAIMMGGTPYYMAQKKMYKKEGMSEAAAKQKAMIDLQQESEDVQQSSRVDQISSQQANTAGRFILAFANTPIQYNRKIYQAFSNIKNRRGDVRKNVGDIIYYMALQNIIFSGLQQAAFMAFNGDDEDEKKAVSNTLNSMASTLLRGTGYWGAGISAVKDVLVAYYQEQDKRQPDNYRVAFQALNFAPAINYKMYQLKKALDYLSWAKKNPGKGIIDNPYLRATTVLGGVVINLPAEEALQFIEQYMDVMNSQLNTMQQAGRALGYSRYQMNAHPWQIEAKKEAEEEAEKASSSSYGTGTYEEGTYGEGTYGEGTYD